MFTDNRASAPLAGGSRARAHNTHSHGASSLSARPASEDALEHNRPHVEALRRAAMICLNPQAGSTRPTSSVWSRAETKGLSHICQRLICDPCEPTQSTRPGGGRPMRADKIIWWRSSKVLVSADDPSFGFGFQIGSRIRIRSRIRDSIHIQLPSKVRWRLLLGPRIHWAQVTGRRPPLEREESRNLACKLAKTMALR